MAISLYDAHNHLQDERLVPHWADIWPVLERESIVRMVVNGSSESDWGKVDQIAREHPRVVPSFGYHPWYVSQRSGQWQKSLRNFLDRRPAVIGEIGLDRWIEGFDLPQQEEVFVWQWLLAAERRLPVTVHCLKAWGPLLKLIASLPALSHGFLLHSYRGPAEMIPALTKLGAYFSISGYFAHDRKGKQREAFRQVPADRLLIETDAPDMSLPSERIQYPLADSKSEAINHPGNLRAVYEFVAELLEEPVASLAVRVERNFQRLFNLPS